MIYIFLTFLSCITLQEYCITENIIKKCNLKLIKSFSTSSITHSYKVSQYSSFTSKFSTHARSKFSTHTVVFTY
ncbi:hypothetical protein VIGAN_03009800 [Vigna angularis var. angularis]|uniref:Secreted protein n=1 Tax=Vigna angularis var. angularis TaxID=157739 RepID=A0A0S3RJ62_PHAAN|nr:hypothetical protein VIGAN_03009800 [Vigna angularis var. angularis]